MTFNTKNSNTASSYSDLDSGHRDDLESICCNKPQQQPQQQQPQPSSQLQPPTPPQLQPLIEKPSVQSATVTTLSEGWNSDSSKDPSSHSHDLEISKEFNDDDVPSTPQSKRLFKNQALRAVLITLLIYIFVFSAAGFYACLSDMSPHGYGSKTLGDKIQLSSWSLWPGKKSLMESLDSMDQSTTFSQGNNILDTRSMKPEIKASFAKIERTHLYLDGFYAESDDSSSDSSDNEIIKAENNNESLLNTDGPYHDETLYKYKNAAVSCDVPICSRLGTDILKRGGSAVDAAITTALCLGSVNSFSSGIGGGGFMLVKSPSSSTHPSLAFNFREKAPAASFKDMYDNDPISSKIGGLAVGVPGELAGLYEAFKRYSSGKLTWAQLIEPVIKLNTEGFIIDEPLARALQVVEEVLVTKPDQWGWLLARNDVDDEPSQPSSWMSSILAPLSALIPNTNAEQILINAINNSPVTSNDETNSGNDAAANKSPFRTKRLGERVIRKKFAQTLQMIAQNGSAEIFYDPKGPIAPALIDTITQSGGIMTLDDLANYDVKVTEPLVTSFLGRKVYTTPNPSSGPILLFGLNLLGGFKDLNKFDETDYDPIATQRLVETMKWMGSSRSQLGDPVDRNNTLKIQAISSPEFADSIRGNISDDTTHPWQFYAPAYEAVDPHGTTHFSVLDANGMAVAMTTTVNLFFGSMLSDPVTGIVLNNEMDDFSVPHTRNAFNLEPSIYNYVAPFKRPLSSCVPTVVTNLNPDGSDRDVELVIGASGGSRILTSVFEGIVRKLIYNDSLVNTIRRARIHHQLLPDQAELEFSCPERVAADLKSRGHNVVYKRPASVSNAIYKNPETNEIHAVADWWRKRGKPAGY